MKFTPQFFPVLKKAQLGEFMPDLPVDKVDKAYAYWLHSFVSKSRMFYNVQFRNHQQVVIREFYKDHGFDLAFSLSEYGEYLDEDLDRYLEREGVLAHQHQHERSESQLKALDESEREITAGGLFYALAESAETGLAHPYFYRGNIDRAWFDWVIQPAPDQQILRQLPYPEYLKTPHWRRIRAAMILIHRCRCQGKQCNGGDGYWLGDEDMVHVHHMSYKNRGGERFDDLRLLCEKCHALVHEYGVEKVFDHPNVNFPTD